MNARSSARIVAPAIIAAVVIVGSSVFARQEKPAGQGFTFRSSVNLINVTATVTDAQGHFEFRTIRPGSYPEGGVPAHIHLIFTTHCCGRQASEMVFDDDPFVTKDFRERQRDPDIFVFARPSAKPDGSQEVSYTIRLRAKGDS